MENRIAELRKEKGWTLKELGKKLEIRDSTLSQYETGKRNPQLGVLQEISNLFGVSLEYLTMGTNKRDYPMKSDGDAIKLIELIDKDEINIMNLSELTSLELSMWILKNTDKFDTGTYSKYSETAYMFLEEVQHLLTFLPRYSNRRKRENKIVEEIYDKLLLGNEYPGASPADVLTFMRESERIDYPEIEKTLKYMKGLPNKPTENE